MKNSHLNKKGPEPHQTSEGRGECLYILAFSAARCYQADTFRSVKVHSISHECLNGLVCGQAEVFVELGGCAVALFGTLPE